MLRMVRFRPRVAVMASAAAAATVLAAPVTPSAAAPSVAAPSPDRGVRLADPFVGTDTTVADQGTGGSAGNMSPAATAPFGMLSFGPRTSPDAVAYGAGYTWSDQRISGFDLTRFQGGGCAGFGDDPVMPTTAPITSSPARAGSFSLDPRLTVPFSHRDESASPGRYAVTLSPGTPRAIRVRLAAATRSGIAEFGFPRQARTGSLVINAGGSRSADEIAAVRIRPHAREVVLTSRTGRFCEQPVGYTVHTVLHFDRPFAGFAVWRRESLTEGGTSAQDRTALPLGYTNGPGLPPTAPGDPSGTAQAGAVVRFALAHHRTVGMRVGISYVDAAGAERNLRAEIGRRSYGQIVRSTQRRWARYLSAVQVSGGRRQDRRMLATMLYQSLLSPQTVSDVDGRYPALDGKVHRARDFTAYSQMSLWDEYRTHAQLLALVAPQVARDIARTLLADERLAGFLPRWPVVGMSPDIMVGDPAIPFLADLREFGVRGFSVAAALRAAVHGAASNGVDDEHPGALAAAGDPETAGGGYYAERPGNPAYLRLHYVPAELDAGTNTTGGIEFVASPDLVWGSVSTGLEYAAADFATAQLAKLAHEPAARKQFLARAGWWRSNFDPALKYVEPRSSTGPFVFTSTSGDSHGFVEGSASQYTFEVPWDVAGLRAALGGPAAMTARLDALFRRLSDGPNSQFAFLGNEPGLDSPYAYLWAGRPAGTQSVIHRALTQLYGPRPTGYPGNDDGGTMSSWWVFNALGLAPPIPGDDVLAVGAPLFPRETVRLGAGRRLRIVAPGGGRGRPYVAGVRVGARSLRRDWLRLPALRRAQVLRISVAQQPTGFARSPGAAPPSY